ncbi:MAG: class I poly(R)-hydroxyalkanoic acid synthase [Deltaproteobacteria bacterium]|nr:class I poly(R)-hydroxyalkanoic acid synthase [Deltaproteobacteria bacterium]
MSESTHKAKGAIPFDAEKWSKSVGELAQRGWRVWMDSLKEQTESGGIQIPDPAVIGKAFMELALKIQAEPRKLAELQAQAWGDGYRLWESTVRRLAGHPAQPVVEPESHDRRFKDAAWQEEIYFDFVKQAYLLTSRWAQSVVASVTDLEEGTAKKIDFYTRQLIEAMSPTNFAATNPKVWQEALETGGQSLLKGFENLLGDMERGEGRLAISMTDFASFKIGENIAVTPGKVIYQNDLMQLIQYAPATDTVCRRPLLIVPPWINKFYILDLQPKNSFIRWAVENGQTVFVISWVNPGKELAHKGFEDYMAEGPLAALDAIELATGEREVNLIGYCIGGTLTASTLGYLAAKEDDRVKSATFFTTLVDFSDVGELSVFIDDEQLHLLDKHMEAQGYLDGRLMGTVFSMLRANDLIWSFVVNNYLLGKDPRPFDLLYWNCDSTRMPAMMHSYYLRKMYLENKLVEPGGISLKGVPIDLRAVKTPVYILSAREDHIAPWKTTYAATQLYSGPVKFVLGGSGHIAGAMNPPSANKYGYWTNGRKPKSPDAWLNGAKEHQGSWWPDWLEWVGQFAGGSVPPREPGSGSLKALEDAPGSYVQVRC